MRFNSNGSINIEETYDGSRRFTKEEFVYLWHLFEKEEPELFADLRSICGFCPVEMFLMTKSAEYYKKSEPK